MQSPHYRKVSGTACAAVAILAVHAMLLAWIAAVNSPTVDEPAHLAMQDHKYWAFITFIVAILLMADVNTDGTVPNLARLKML